MAKPVVVDIPHRLGKEEATRRLKSGLDRVVQAVGDKAATVEQKWAGDHLDFSVRIFGQNTSGMLDVADEHVHLELQLPWGLGLLAQKAKGMIQERGKLLLEKK
jgi:hypothetical protein